MPLYRMVEIEKKLNTKSTSSYKYLGILISSLSWSPHINAICKSQKIISRHLLFFLPPCFSLHPTQTLQIAHLSSLHLLFLSLRSSIKLSGCSPSWENPAVRPEGLLPLLEGRFWHSSHPSLFFPLFTHRSISKLIFLYKVIHNLIHLPNLCKLLKFKGPPRYSIRSSYF